jgi:hypothetical protein
MHLSHPPQLQEANSIQISSIGMQFSDCWKSHGPETSVTLFVEGKAAYINHGWIGKDNSGLSPPVHSVPDA